MHRSSLHHGGKEDLLNKTSLYKVKHRDFDIMRTSLIIPFASKPRKDQINLGEQRALRTKHFLSGDYILNCVSHALRHFDITTEVCGKFLTEGVV